MRFNYLSIGAAVLTSAMWSPSSSAECAAPESAKHLDPVEVGFCASDAVFVGKSEGAIETIRAHTPEGSTTTKHIRIQRTAMRVTGRIKGELSDKVTMIADIYAKDSYVFEYGNTYLIFAKRLPGENEYAGANSCSVQSTLPIENAAAAINQLEDHVKGRQKIDCKNIRPKPKD